MKKVVFSQSIFNLQRKTRLRCSHYFQNRFFLRIPYYKEQSSVVDAFTSVLRTFPNAGSPREIHACIVTCGLSDSILLGSKLLNCYASFGILAYAQQVFDKIANRNLSLWNSAIVSYFRSGYFCEVVKLYSALKERGIEIDSSALNFGLKSCSELRYIGFGRSLHGDSLKLSLNVDRFVGSSLVGLYSNWAACVEDARKAFDEMVQRDVVSYTAMVTRYSQVSDFRAIGAFEITFQMQDDGVDPNRVTLVSLLQAACRLEALEEGKSIHSYAIRRGYCGNGDAILETGLIDMYMKCGATHAATVIFDRKAKIPVASWNVMIAGLVRSGMATKALELFCAMKCNEARPDSITVANALLGCSTLRSIWLGSSIHGYIIRAGVQLDLLATTSLIDMYSKCNCIIEARELFKKVENNDIVTINVMISCYRHCGFFDEAFEVFYGLFERALRPNSATMIIMLSVAADQINVKKGRCIHGYIVRHGFEMVVEVANHILDMYLKCGRVASARTMFGCINNKNLVSWTLIMMGYVNHGLADEALATFHSMQGATEEPDSISLMCLLQSFSQLGCLKETKEVHGFVYRNHWERDVIIINSLVTTYAKCGKLDMAITLFNNSLVIMRQGQSTSWNAMIAAYGMHGKCKEALSLFHQMEDQKVEPDEVTFTSLLSACSHVGLVEEAHLVFCSMTAEHSITPRIEHYSCMVDLLGRAGYLKEAFELIKFLPLEDNVSAWSALLAACRVHGNSQLGEIVGKKILDMKLESPSTYASISSIYAEAGRWKEVAELRGKVKEKGLKKMPGYSLIQLEKRADAYGM